MAGAEFHLIFPSITGFPLLDICIFLARFLTTNSELAVRSGKKPRAADIYLILQVERRRSNRSRLRAGLTMILPTQNAGLASMGSTTPVAQYGQPVFSARKIIRLRSRTRGQRELLHENLRAALVLPTERWNALSAVARRPSTMPHQLA
jgi:hypothetical protein